MAEATKIGAMIAEYQPSREICKPKIHAVTLCTRMAMGRAKRLMTATFFGSAFCEHMKYRYRMLMMR